MFSGPNITMDLNMKWIWNGLVTYIIQNILRCEGRKGLERYESE